LVWKRVRKKGEIMTKGKNSRNKSLLDAATAAMTSKAKDKKIAVEVVRACDLKELEYIETGNPAFDLVFGGFPRGRFSIIYGGPGCGKTSFILRAIAHQQKNDIGVFLCESEQSFSKKWAAANGVDLENLAMTQSTDVGDVLDAVTRIAATGKADIIYIDSLAALSPAEMRKKGVGADDMAIFARRLSRFFQIAPETTARTNTAIVFVTQKRDSLDLFSGGLEQYPGGNALKHHLSVAINVRRSGMSKLRDKGTRFLSSGDKIGFPSMWKCVKSKIDVVENTGVIMDFFMGRGYDNRSTIFELAVSHGIIVKTPPAKYQFMYSNGDVYKQVGYESVIRDIQSDDNLYAQLISAVKARCTPGDFTTPPAEVDVEYEEKVNREIREEYELKEKQCKEATE